MDASSSEVSKKRSLEPDSDESNAETKKQFKGSSSVIQTPSTVGKWTLHISLPIEFSKEQSSFIDKLVEKVRSFSSQLNLTLDGLCLCDEFHVSLSKPTAIKHSICQKVSASIQDCFQPQIKLNCKLISVDLFQSDSETTKDRIKYFIAFELAEEDLESQLMTRVHENINLIFKKFKLSSFYKNPRFHVSFAFFFINNNQLERSFLKTLKDEIKKCDVCSEKAVCLDRLKIKTGNKLTFCKFN